MKPPTKDGAPARRTIVFNAQWLVDRATGDTFWNGEHVGKIAFGNHGVALEELLSACNSHAALVAVADAAAFIESLESADLRPSHQATVEDIKRALAQLAAVWGGGK